AGDAHEPGAEGARVSNRYVIGTDSERTGRVARVGRPSSLFPRATTARTNASARARPADERGKQDRPTARQATIHRAWGCRAGSCFRRDVDPQHHLVRGAYSTMSREQLYGI